MKYIMAFITWIFPLALLVGLFFWIAPTTAHNFFNWAFSLEGRGDQVVTRALR